MSIVRKEGWTPHGLYWGKCKLCGSWIDPGSGECETSECKRIERERRRLEHLARCDFKCRICRKPLMISSSGRREHNRMHVRSGALVEMEHPFENGIEWFDPADVKEMIFLGWMRTPYQVSIDKHTSLIKI